MKKFKLSKFENLLENAGFKVEEYNSKHFSLGKKFNEKFSYYNFDRSIDGNTFKVKGYSFDPEGKNEINIEFEIDDKTESEVLYEILSNESILKSMSKAWKQEITIDMIHEKLNIELKDKQYLQFMGESENSLNIRGESEKIAVYRKLSNYKIIVEVV